MTQAQLNTVKEGDLLYATDAQDLPMHGLVVKLYKKGKDPNVRAIALANLHKKQLHPLVLGSDYLRRSKWQRTPHE